MGDKVLEQTDSKVLENRGKRRIWKEYRRSCLDNKIFYITPKTVVQIVHHVGQKYRRRKVIRVRVRQYNKPSTVSCPRVVQNVPDTDGVLRIDLF